MYMCLRMRSKEPCLLVCFYSAWGIKPRALYVLGTLLLSYKPAQGSGVGVTQNENGEEGEDQSSGHISLQMGTTKVLRLNGL